MYGARSIDLKSRRLQHLAKAFFFILVVLAQRMNIFRGAVTVEGRIRIKPLSYLRPY